MRPLLPLVATLGMGLHAAAADVRLSTSDGQTIHASIDGKGRSGVVLVHDKARTGRDYQLLGDKLVAKGFRVARVDLRGHGASAGASGDGPSMVHDVTAAMQALRDAGAEQVHLVGAGLGANLVVHAAGSEPPVAGLVLLSPGLSVQGVKIVSAYGAVADRPVLLASATDDDDAARTIRFLEGKATGPHRSFVVEGSATGAELLRTDATLEDHVVSWLEGRYESQGADPNAVEVSIDLRTHTSSGAAFGSED